MKPILSYPSFSTEATLLITGKDGLHNLRISQIMYCNGNDKQTEFHLANGQIFQAYSSLTEYEELLKNYGFFRSHSVALHNHGGVNLLVYEHLGLLEQL